MIASPELILFAIQAGARLGSKLYNVLVDETVERPLLLPVGDLFGDVRESQADRFFLRPENIHLIREGGAYFNLDPHEKLIAYKSLLAIDERVGAAGEGCRSAVEVVGRISALEQWKAGFGANHPARRVLGTLVEIGIDYFSANPEALGKDSTHQRLVHAFVSALDEADFAEGDREAILGHLFSATLQTLGDHAALVSDDVRVRALLSGVTKAVLADLQGATSRAARLRRERLFRRIGSSLLRGGANALTANVALFLPDDETASVLVESTLKQVIGGIEGREDLFTTDSIELLFSSSLRAAAENAHLFTERNVLRDLIRRTVAAITSAQGRRLFSPETAAAILGEAIETAGENIETLLDPDNPQKQLLASAVGAMAHSLAGSVAGGRQAADLLSRQQLVELTRIVFTAVANQPELLLGGNLANEKKTALAQIIGSIARALGSDPGRYLNGAGLVELIRIALRVGVCNADKLIDLSTISPRSNVLFQALAAVVEAIEADGDPRRLIGREVFLEVARRVLPLVSANLETVAGTEERVVLGAVRAALSLASGTLENRIDGTNLPPLIEQLLRQVLWGELSLADSESVEIVARAALRDA